MSVFKKTMTAWGLGVVAFSLSYVFLPHREISVASFFVYSLQFLLFIITLKIVRREPAQKNRYLFINFAALFSVSIPTHFFYFIGPHTGFLTEEKYAPLYANQYVFLGLYYFLLAASIAYLTIDVLFRDFKTYQKYVLTLSIVGSFFGYYYGGFFSDPKYAYGTPDVQDWKQLSSSWYSYQDEHGVAPSPEELASITSLQAWKSGKAVGVLYPEERLQRVNALYMYLPDNYIVLLYKPLFLNVIQMCVVCIGFILLFFGYTYMKDPPQGAYIEKIMFLLLIFCSLEILHSWAAIKTVELAPASVVWAVGQYISTAVLVLIAGAFGMRLRFITSVKGEFYEQELAVSPKRVTRWRDALDNLVIEKFFDRKVILGRMFVSTSNRKP
ncbi:MAG: hypothetical protein AB1428_06740 [Bacteroidota bacterium]